MQVLVLGSQYWPPGQSNGVGPWPSGMQVLVTGSQYWPPGQFSGSADPMAVGAMAPTARGAAANATAVARPNAMFLIANLPSRILTPVTHQPRGSTAVPTRSHRTQWHTVVITVALHTGCGRSAEDQFEQIERSVVVMNNMVAFLPLLIVMGAFMFFASRRQKRAMQATIDLHESLRIGDRVHTTSGLQGTITGITDDDVDLEISPGVVTTWMKLAVRDKIEPEDFTAEAAIEQAAEGA